MTDLPSAGHSRPRRKILSGVALGAAIGLATWAFYGAVIGAGVVIVVGTSARLFITGGYVPYHATFLGDVAFLARWLAILLGIFGLFAGATIGLRIGRRMDPGEPRGATILRWTQRTLMSTLFTLAARGKPAMTHHIPLDAMASLEDDLEVTAGWTAWGVIFLMITAFLFVPTSVVALYQAVQMKPIEVNVTKVSEGYNTLFVDGTYTDQHGTQQHGSYQREGSPLPDIKVGDRIRIQPHRNYGFGSGEQVMLPGENPDEMHSPNWGRFYAGVLSSVLLLPFACFFFGRAVFRP